MKTIEDFQHKVYIINHNNEVEEMTYADYLNEFWSDETTSPRGVENRLHIREVEVSCDCSDEDEDGVILHEDDCNDGATEYQVWTWGVGGNHPRYVETFETEEEAEVSILEGKEYDYFNNSSNAPALYDTFEEAEISRIELAAEAMGVDIEVFVSIDKKSKLVEEKRAEKAIENKRKQVAVQQEVFAKYSNLISKIETESYKETCNRLAAVLPEKIQGTTFHNIVKFVRSKK